MPTLSLLKSKQPQFGLSHLLIWGEAVEAKKSSILNWGHFVKIILELNLTADVLIFLWLITILHSL